MAKMVKYSNINLKLVKPKFKLVEMIFINLQLQSFTKKKDHLQRLKSPKYTMSKSKHRPLPHQNVHFTTT